MHAYIDLFTTGNLENTQQMAYIWFTVRYAVKFLEVPDRTSCLPWKQQ